MHASTQRLQHAHISIGIQPLRFLYIFGDNHSNHSSLDFAQARASQTYIYYSFLNCGRVMHAWAGCMHQRCHALYIFQSAFSLCYIYCELFIRYTLYTHARPCTPNLYNQYSFTVVHGGADARLDRNAHANLAAASCMGIARAM